MLPEMDIEGEDEAVPVMLTLGAGDRPERPGHGGFTPPTAPAPLG